MIAHGWAHGHYTSNEALFIICLYILPFLFLFYFLLSIAVTHIDWATWWRQFRAAVMPRPIEQHVLMAAVAPHPSAYGVSIQDHIRRLAGYEPSIGSIYAAIDRLEEKGFLASHQGEAMPERGGKRKLLVTVTAAGAMALGER